MTNTTGKHVDNTGAASSEPTSPPASYTLVTPEEWWRVPLHPAERRHTSVQRLVQRQFRGVDDQPLLRRDAEQQLRERADRAAAGAGGIELYLSNQVVGGAPLSSSLLVSMLPPGTPTSVQLLRETMGGDGALDIDRIDAGPVLRRHRQLKQDPEEPELAPELVRTTVDYWIPVPAGDSCLQLSFSTPMPDPLVEALVELFDAVTGTLRWIWTEDADD